MPAVVSPDMAATVVSAAMSATAVAAATTTLRMHQARGHRQDCQRERSCPDRAHG
jgi:hypothetical protein